MKASPFLTSIIRRIDFLTRPSPLLESSLERQQARLLASLSLSMFLIELFGAPIWILTMPSFMSVPLIVVGMLLAFGAIYALSRTQYYRYGAFMLVTAFLLFVLYVLVLIPVTSSERLLVLKYLVFVLMLADIFLKRIITIGFLFIIYAIVIAFFFVPGVSFIYVLSYLIFFVLISLMGSISSVASMIYHAQLMESEDRYRSVVSALSAGVVMQTRDGAIRAANESAARILGLTVEQMMGRESVDPRWRAVHEDGTPFPGESHPAMVTLRTGEPQSNVIMGVHRPDGELVWISINSHPLTRPGEALPYAVVTSFTDITEVRRAQQQEFQIALERERVTMLTQFVQSAAHEFRTPLGIINSTGYLMARTEDGAQRAVKQAQIEREVYRIVRLVDMMLTLVKLESQTLELGTQIDFYPFLRSICVSVFSVEAPSAALHVDIPDDKIMVRGDLAYLTEAFRQILENARRFTPPEGAVTVISRVLDGEVCIQVTDTGSGIAPDKLARIFDSFWREDQAHTTPGFGLGLAIARRVIDQHGGTIAVESAVGVGTTIQVRLPLVVETKTDGS
jgi:PAS domain S-box-containing protein